MKQIKQIEIYYTDDSMEKITSNQGIFQAIVEEINITKELYETADTIAEEYNKLVKKNEQ